MSDETMSEMLGEDDYGGFFSPLENTKPYAKVAFEGMPGSGKTHTMVQLAIWLHQRIGSKKPVAFFDTEESAKFHQARFKAAGIHVLHKRSRSFADFCQTMKLGREGHFDIMLTDSISHLWEDFVEAYKRRKNKNRHRLDFADWGVLKPLWRQQFSDPIVRDPYHVLFTGRAAYEYEEVLNEDTQRYEPHKSGIKMRAEGETAYEPDILVLMERHEDVLSSSKKEIFRLATILKDRSGVIDGKTFKNPAPEHFAEAMEVALATPVNRAPPIEGDTGMMFESEDDKREWFRRRDIALENIENTLVKAFPSTSGNDRSQKIAALDFAFKTASWTWLKTQRPEFLEDGLHVIRKWIADADAAARAEVEAEGPDGEKNGNGGKPHRKGRTRPAAA